MSTSQHTLSAEQLEGFLQNKLAPDEMKRVQHLLDDCELSREALEGYTMVPGAFADVEAIKNTIAKKSGMSVSWGTITIGVAAIALISVLVTMFYSEDTPVVALNDSVPQLPQVVDLEPVNILSPQEDHFVNPEAKVVSITVQDLHVTTVDSESVTFKENLVLEPVPRDQKQNPIVDSIPVEPKKKEITYNASAGFIVDLKVTNYDIYYATPIEVKEIKLTGVPARYEDEDGIEHDMEEEPTVRIVPSDQFLREGLIAFRDGRYGKCVSKMEVLLEKNPNDINALFYTAVSYVKLEMYSKAIPLLDQIIEDENNVFDEEAEWYKALALEGNGDTGAAQALFKKIADEGGFYSKQAGGRLK